jgi:hypothetical protein
MFKKEKVTKDQIFSNLQSIVTENGNLIEAKISKRMDKMSSFLVKAVQVNKKSRYENSFLQ